MAGIIGYQIADRSGANIQGDEGDPSGYPSFRVLSMAEADAVVVANPDADIMLMPVRESDIEDPELP